jgi:hypothetical protein
MNFTGTFRPETRCECSQGRARCLKNGIGTPHRDEHLKFERVIRPPQPALEVSSREMIYTACR